MASNDSCEAAPAPWLDRELVENMLKRSENDESIRVKSVSGKPATAKGDNYMSEIIRINVTFTRGLSNNELMEHKSFIFKVELINETFTADLSRSCGVFDTEIEMMANTLIEMTKILNEKGVRFGARVYHSKIANPSFIAMEDLGALGYRMASRRDGLDLQHGKLVIGRLAKYHATSVALREKNPTLTDRYAKNVYEKGNIEPIKVIVKNAMVSIATESAKWTDLDSRIPEKLLKLAETSYDRGVKSMRTKKDEFNVLIHGDCWVNNMLFRYNEKDEVIDQIFVDFQLPMWTSPAVDLIYFLTTSISAEVRDHHYDELIEDYCNTLTSTMSRIGCRTKPPSLESLRKSLQERSYLALFFSTLALPFILADKTEIIDVSELMDAANNGQVTPGYKGQRFRQTMEKRLKEWDSQGLLDF